MGKEWYEKLGFSENPFDTKKFFEIVGHHNLKHDILYFIKSGSLVFLEGKKGSGKTALLKYIMDAWREDGKVIYLNCKNTTKNFNINRFVMNSVGFFGKLLNKKPKGVVLLVDNAEHLTEKNCERIKFLYDHNYIRSAVFVGSHYKDVRFSASMKQRFANRVTSLKELDENDAIKIVRERIQDHRILSNDLVKEIFLRSQKNPRLFLQNCEKICVAATEERKRKVTEDVLNRILPLKHAAEMELGIPLHEDVKEHVIVHARSGP